MSIEVGGTCESEVIQESSESENSKSSSSENAVNTEKFIPSAGLETPKDATYSNYSTQSSGRKMYATHTDTHSRIFGNYAVEDDTPKKSLKSNIPHTEGEHLEKNVAEERVLAVKKPDGNPLTGEGYAAEYMGPKLKVPPGGFSSGLW